MQTTIVEKKMKKLLVIDDNPVDNIITNKFLKNSKLAKEYITIDSSLEAYDYLFEEINVQTEFPEVILLDLNMSIYNGFDFLEKIEKLTKEVQIKPKVYILTSSSNPDDIRRATSFKSVAGYFVKPFSQDQIGQITYY